MVYLLNKDWILEDQHTSQQYMEVPDYQQDKISHLYIPTES